MGRLCIKGIYTFLGLQNTKHIFTAKAYHMLQKKTEIQNTLLHSFTHFYTCVSGFFLGLHMCKWIFLVYTCVSGFFVDLHILTHPYTSIHIQVYCGLFGSFFS